VAVGGGDGGGGTGGVALLRLSRRTNRQPMPRVLVADMREELAAGNRGMIGGALMEALRGALGAGRQAILFLNRRGYASFLLCRDCGYVVSCPDCAVSYTYHQERGGAGERLVCHYCGRTAPAPAACPGCGGGRVAQFGVGTERLEEEIGRLFPGARALRMDRDTVSRKGAHERILDAFRDGAADILVGTQMIAKGHDFPNVSVAGVLSADAILNFCDFRATERAFQLLTQAAGRAGRGGEQGLVVIQTYNPDHYSVRMAQRHDYEGFYRQESAARAALGYPPFGHLGVALVQGADGERAYAMARAAHEALAAERVPGLTLLGPAQPPVARVRGKHRWRSVLKHADEGEARRALALYARHFRGGRPPRGVELACDQDPNSMP
jgi:primosomal protein N' (replication factor Y)